MRNRGMTYREIGQHFGVRLQRIWSILQTDDLSETVRLWRIDSAVELKTWLAQRGELHLHHEHEKDGMSRWMAVERTTAKCGTRRCLRVPTKGGS